MGEAEGTTTDDIPKPHLTHKPGDAQFKSQRVKQQLNAGEEAPRGREKDLVPAGTSGLPVPRMHGDITLDGAVSVLLSRALRYSTLLPAPAKATRGSDPGAEPSLCVGADC